MFSARRPTLPSPPPLAGEVGPAEPGREGALFSFMVASRMYGSPSPTLPRRKGVYARLRRALREREETADADRKQTCRSLRSLRRTQLRLHLIEQLLDLAALELGDVVLVLQQHTKRVGHR